MMILLSDEIERPDVEDDVVLEDTDDSVGVVEIDKKPLLSRRRH